MPQNAPYILLQGSEYATVEKGAESLKLLASGISVLEVGKKGIMSKYPGVTLDLDASAGGNYLGMKVNFNAATIGYLAIRLGGVSVGVFPSRVFPEILSNSLSPIIIETISNRYNAVNEYLGNSTAGAKGVALYQSSDDTSDFTPDETLLGGDGVY